MRKFTLINKYDYAQANKDWLETKAKEEGVKPLPKGIYYKVISEGKNGGRHPSPAVSLPHTTRGGLYTGKSSTAVVVEHQ